MKLYNCLECDIGCKFDIRKVNKYCSVKCQMAYQNKQRIEEWLLTGEISNKSQQTSKWLKKYVLEKQGYACKKCSITEWQGKPIVFDLEHIDGDSSNMREDNLCCLCPNCHSQTPTYKGANKGSGRHSRKQRYIDNKSF